jgi:DNA invertase Pin-like site-specific DNA recombinase
VSRHRRALGYARVSSQEQALGSSLRDQQASIAAYAKSIGLPVAKFYVEAHSAVRERIEHREQIRQLMRDVRAGDIVIVDKLDRWSRDPEFSYRSVREILEVGAAFYAVSDSCDPSTRDGDTMLNFRILFAREEHKRIKERMVGTRKILRDQGFYVEGLPPYAYRRSHPKGYKGVEKNVLVVEAAEAAVVRRAFMLAAGGRSLSQIAERLGLERDRVHDILTNRLYLGEVKDSRGQWIKGKQPAIIDVALFVKASEGRAKRKHVGQFEEAETRGWILRDVAVCGRCAAKMSAAYAGPLTARRYYYHCTKRCTTRYVPVRLIELAVEPLVVARLVELRELLARPEEEPSSPRPVADLGKKRKTLERRRARALELYMDGLTERPAMLTEVARIDAELLRLRAADAPSPPPTDQAARRAVLRDVVTLEKAWRRAGPPRRRAIVTALALSVGLTADEPPLPVWRTPQELALRDA